MKLKDSLKTIENYFNDLINNVKKESDQKFIDHNENFQSYY